MKLKRNENELELLIPEGIEAVLTHSILKQIGAKQIQINKSKRLSLSDIKDEISFKGGQYTIRLVE
jgi:hypothetical protein